MSEMKLGNPILVDYEKKHKEEVVRATQLWECGDITRENLEYIFPELKESEDERISREITEFILTHRIDEPNDIENTNSWLAWLEKQGDTNKTIDKDEIAQDVLRGAAINLITWIDYNAAEGNTCLSNTECKDIQDALVSGDWNKIYAYIKKKLEKQGDKQQGKTALEAANEEKVDNQNCVKPADKVEPKFKVEKGKWYVCTQTFVLKGKIVIIKGQTYQAEKDNVIKGENGCCFINRHDGKASDYFRPWAIADAKPGDVLTSSHGQPFIYNGYYNSYNVGAYGGRCCIGGEFMFSPTGKYWTNNIGIHPATKEQRDLLFQKMKEAGWKWDKEKKGLKKIEED